MPTAVAKKNSPPVDLDSASAEFLGQWQRLVSSTNWEKGRIIFEWRAALIAADAPVAEYADDAWSRRVGSVSPQHVGRLRRVWERFGATRDTFAGLFWSHFQAALDWDDAEMWLEGAVQSRWSVADMRRERWQQTGAVAADEPRASDVVDAEHDEDAVSEDSEILRTGESHSSDHTAPFGESADDVSNEADDETASADETNSSEASVDLRPEPSRPFAALPELPADMADAFEAFKLCIVRQRLSHWAEISRDDVLATLDALKELALAPVET